MDDVQRNPLLGWAYFCNFKDTEELRHSLLYLTLEKCQKLFLNNLLLTQKLQQQFTGGVSAVKDDPPLPPLMRTEFEYNNNNNGFSSFSLSDSDDSIVSSTLPEKGKLLQAVMKVGPLLQTLLLAGPLPQWKHPPPPLDPFNIPPVGIPVPCSHH